MGTAFETLAASAAEEREQLRDERHELFTRRFDPSAIFERAGIHTWLQQRYAAHALHALQQPCTPGITNMTTTGAAAGSDELTVLSRACFVEEGAVLLLNAHYENEEVLIVENVQPTHWWERLIAGEGVASAAHVLGVAGRLASGPPSPPTPPPALRATLRARVRVKVRVRVRVGVRVS